MKNINMAVTTPMPLLDHWEQSIESQTQTFHDLAADHRNENETYQLMESDSEGDRESVIDLEQTTAQPRQGTFDNSSQHEPGHDIDFKTPALLARKEVTARAAKIIDNAREYQTELYERAKQENVIAVLDTGSGKTLIACMLVRYMLERELIDRSQSKPSRVPIFIANSVHLVHQQAGVLAGNLPISPTMFVGSDKAEAWKKHEFWVKVLEDNRPVVCTPAILQQCLDGALINIEQISLLVFDEAHHAKRNHPYSRIIRSYYMSCSVDKRPKIFGMTASPVDSKGNIDSNAADLERLLHSKIVTTNDLSILSFAPKPIDVRWSYPRPQMSLETDFHSRLWSKCHFAVEAKKGFEFSKRAVSELGVWCADRVWKFIIGTSELEVAGFIKKYENSNAYNDLSTVEAREIALESLKEATILVMSQDIEFATPSTTQLSPKVLRLYEEILPRYTTYPETRAIIFVDQQLTALVLNDCFLSLKVPNLRPGVLLGASTEWSSLTKQDRVIDDFRAGFINLVFATSVADEGIDIPQCNLCIRFDLYKTPIQYMQSRGRARMRGSVYAHMIQEDEKDHEYMVKYAMDSDRYIKDFCQSLPADRLLGRSTKLDRLIAQDAASRSFKTDIGAVCDFGNSLLILARFISSLRRLGAVAKETFEEDIDFENKLFRYVVILPVNTDMRVHEKVRGARGEWKQNKQLAKRSAAFNCCLLLRKKGMLNERLYSVYQKVKPENLNAHLAVSEKKSSYSSLVKPAAWTYGLGEIPQTLHGSIITFKPQRPLLRPLTPLVVLTRVPLPMCPIFSVFLEDNISTTVTITKVARALRVSSTEVEVLTKFTLDGVFFDLFNKTYRPDARDVSYWLAPPCQDWASEATTIHQIVDFEAAKEVELGRIKWKPGLSTNQAWTNKFICDPNSAAYHYFSSDIAPGISVFDPIPDTVPSIPQKGKKNIIDFSDGLWKGSKMRRDPAWCDPHQPVLHAEILMARRNLLEPGSEKDCRRIMCQIGPQPLEVSRLSPGFAATCFIWPAVIHRIESYMLSLEAFDKLDLPGIPAEVALEAFTKDGDHNENEDQLHSTGQQGMAKNYERLEFIGDSLLKMMTTITVYNRTNCDEEGMHCRRMEILCNRRLFDVSTEKHRLYLYARTKTFDKTTWYPENLVLLSGRGAVPGDPRAVKHKEITQNLGMKTIADISEAIIGAAVTASRGSCKPLDLGIKAITTLVDSEDHAINSWDEIRSIYKPAEWSLQMNDVQAMKLAKDVAARTGYTFNYPRLLRSAFTHSSDLNSTVPNLQRLEFLGDAVLDWVSISWLFNENPYRNPQWLTEHKMAMVSNMFLAALAVTMDFDKFISCSTAKLFADITEYAKKVRELHALKDVSRDFWTRIRSPPKALSDLVESYLGAVLVDSNWNYQEIEIFFKKHVLWFFEDISLYDSFVNRHPTTYLIKKFQNEYKCRDFDVLDKLIESGSYEGQVATAVMVHGAIIARSYGTSARYGRLKVCKRALEIMEGMTPEEFRAKYGCICQAFGD